MNDRQVNLRLESFQYNERRVCNTGRYAIVSSVFPHFGEEDCLRGWNGSSTIFFGLCNLRCVFCQNWDISHVNVMAQYRPQHQVGRSDRKGKYQDINRRPYPEEIHAAYAAAREAGLWRFDERW